MEKTEIIFLNGSRISPVEIKKFLETFGIKVSLS